MIRDVSAEWVRACDTPKIVGAGCELTARKWMARCGVEVFVFSRRAHLVRLADLQKALALHGPHRNQRWLLKDRIAA